MYEFFNIIVFFGALFVIVHQF